MNTELQIYDLNNNCPLLVDYDNCTIIPNIDELLNINTIWYVVKKRDYIIIKNNNKRLLIIRIFVKRVNENTNNETN